MRSFWYVLALSPLLAACAGEPNWVNPNLPQSRWDRDLARCQRDAESIYSVGNRFEPDDRSVMPGRLLDRQQIGPRINAYVESCMRGQGYFPRGEEKEAN